MIRSLIANYPDQLPHIRFSQQGSGRFEGWLDGEQLGDYNGDLGYATSAYHYMKLGFYSGVKNLPVTGDAYKTAYYDQIRMAEGAGDLYEVVAPSACHSIELQLFEGGVGQGVVSLDPARRSYTFTGLDAAGKTYAGQVRAILDGIPSPWRHTQ